jgi:aminoglycoside phosphotransferase (APT) family kinase protein
MAGSSRRSCPGQSRSLPVNYDMSSAPPTRGLTTPPRVPQIRPRRRWTTRQTRAVRKADITADLVGALIAAQFPEWSSLPVRPVEIDGWDNTTFRLGSSMSVRLPSADAYVAQIDKEQRWLPVLAPQLPLPVPGPLARGEPSSAFPRPWSVYRWIDGDLLTMDRVNDLEVLASDLAAFLAALHVCEPAGPAPGPHSFSRGGPVATWDEQTRANLDALRGVVDTSAALHVWEAALAAVRDASPVWVHGDVTGANLLVRDGRLAGVIDFGCSAFGDPACDLTIAWTFLSGDSRARLRASVPVEPSAWARGRGWALWKALNHVAADQANPGQGQRSDRRVGWRFSAGDVVAEVINDHHRCSA